MAYKRALTGDQIEYIVSRVGNKTMKDIAQELNVSSMTVRRYVERFNILQGKESPKEARQKARKAGKIKYSGKVCISCGDTERYVSTNKCVACLRKRVGKINSKGRNEKEENRRKEDYMQVLSYHKQNLQLSCQQWG